MTSGPGSIAQKLWSLCDLLRDDGITNQDYLRELTWLLFLFVDDRAPLDHIGGTLPRGNTWADLVSQPVGSRLSFYRDLLDNLSGNGNASIAMVFSEARTSMRDARVLDKLVEAIEAFDWPKHDSEFFGDVYESLIERSTNELRSGAGQYFTPRYLTDFIVDLMQPLPTDVIQDPAAGTGGFLIAAANQLGRARSTARFVGVELVPDVFRLLSMNMLLHGTPADLRLGDTLTDLGTDLPAATLILSNPPFGTKRGAGLSVRPDLTYQSSNKQLMFLQHIYRSLRIGGRAAVVLPDGVLFEEGVAAAIRSELLSLCSVTGLVHLPSGLFYSTGVKTSVLFITRGAQNSASIPVFDARTNVNGRSRTDVESQLQPFRDAWFSKRPVQHERLEYIRESDFALNGLRIGLTQTQPPPRELDAILEEMTGSLASALALLQDVKRACQTSE